MRGDDRPARRRLPPAAPRTLERQAWAEGYQLVAGVDEAGRGALAGPVVAAAVILPPTSRIPHVTDSKLLSPEDRAALWERITAEAVSWAVGVVAAPDIDRLNILRATHRAMREALSALAPAPALVLVDGLPLPGTRIAQRNVVGGDRRCYAIAAASIIAKVTRDRLMCELDGSYPQYGFAEHKGYATPPHLEALRRHGPCPVHRMSFAPCRECSQLVMFERDDLELA